MGRLSMAGLVSMLIGSSACFFLTNFDGLSGPASESAGDASSNTRDGGLGASDGGPDAPTPDGAALVIARTSPGLRGLAVDATHVFFANEDTGELRSAPKQGDPDGASNLLGAFYKPTDLAVDATRLYWIDQDPKDVYQSGVYSRSKKDGSDPIKGEGYHVSARLTLAAGHVYTSTLNASNAWLVMRDGVVIAPFTIERAPRCVVSDGATTFYELLGVIHEAPEVDGGAPFATAEAIDAAVDDVALYWITSSGQVQKLDKAKRGQTPVTLASGISGLARIVVDERSVYVTAWGLGAATGRALRIPKAGGPTVDVATGQSEPWGIAVDSSNVYVANHGDGTVIAVPHL